MTRVTQLKLGDNRHYGDTATEECAVVKLYFFKSEHDGKIHLHDGPYTNGGWVDAWCEESVRGFFMLAMPDENDVWCEVCFPPPPPMDLRNWQNWKLVPVIDEEAP